MIPWKLINVAPLPGGEGDLRLMQRGAEFSIMLGGNELMNSRLSGSEEALASLAVAKLRNPAASHLLIGGLGMGFTLRAALAALPVTARVSVAELVPAVVEWAKGPMADVFGSSLAEPRVEIITQDVREIIRGAKARYDAILLDVDNGPDGLTVKSNDALYSHTGLSAAHAALRAGGVLTVWSAGPDESFTRRLKKAGFAIEVVQVRARDKRGARHTIWVACRPD